MASTTRTLKCLPAQVDLRHMCEIEGSNTVDLGIDLSEFYMSVEWDILEVPAVRYVPVHASFQEMYFVSYRFVYKINK